MGERNERKGGREARSSRSSWVGERTERMGGREAGREPKLRSSAIFHGQGNAATAKQEARGANPHDEKKSTNLELRFNLTEPPKKGYLSIYSTDLYRGVIIYPWKPIDWSDCEVWWPVPYSREAGVSTSANRSSHTASGGRNAMQSTYERHQLMSVILPVRQKFTRRFRVRPPQSCRQR